MIFAFEGDSTITKVFFVVVVISYFLCYFFRRITINLKKLFCKKKLSGALNSNSFNLKYGKYSTDRGYFSVKNK